MGTRQTHRDVEFVVPTGNGDRTFKTFDDAALVAVVEALVRGGARIDVLVHSEAGAVFYGGDDGLELYRDDPEASVFDRIEVHAESHGRVA